MRVLVLSKDKISQNMFRAQIKNIAEWASVGTHSNQTAVDINQRLEFSTNKPKTLFFHALKKSFFVATQDWLPEPTADVPKALWEASDVVIYTRTLFQGGGYTVLKGTLENSGLLIEQE